MERFAATIDIVHRPGILDPQGATIDRALPALGYSNVSQVTVGKVIRLVVEAESVAAAEAQVSEMCHRLLANPVIEAFSIAVAELS